MPMRFRWLIGAAFVGIAMSFAGIALATATQDAVTIVDCQDRFLLDRRDNPDNATKNFHQCTAIQNVELTLENFTFWYVTLPEKPHPAEDSWFIKVYRDDAAILTSPAVGLGQQKALGVLDDSIVRGLKRGKRDDLVSQWLNTHNPQLFIADRRTPEQPKLASATMAAAPLPTAAPPTVAEKPPVAATPPQVAAVMPAPKPEPAKRTLRPVRRRIASEPYPEPAPQAVPSAQELNRAEPVGGLYAPPEPPSAAPVYYPVNVAPPPYYAPAPRPSAYYSPPVPALAYAPPPPPSAPPVAVPPVAPVAALPAAPAAMLPPPPMSASLPAQQQAPPPQMSQPAAVSQTAVPAAPAPPRVRTIPEQVEFNIRTVVGLINSNIETVQQTIFGPLPAATPSR